MEEEAGVYIGGQVRVGRTRRGGGVGLAGRPTGRGARRTAGRLLGSAGLVVGRCGCRLGSSLANARARHFCSLLDRVNRGQVCAVVVFFFFQACSSCSSMCTTTTSAHASFFAVDVNLVFLVREYCSQSVER